MMLNLGNVMWTKMFARYADTIIYCPALLIDYFSYSTSLAAEPGC